MVLVHRIHGMGERRLMDTLWSFLDGTWLSDADLVEPHGQVVYSKPAHTESLHELRRIAGWSLGLIALAG